MALIASFGDAVVYSEDVALLKGPHWINDALITFYYEYLTDHLRHQSTNSNALYTPESICLLHPASVFLASIAAPSPEAAHELLSGMNLSSKSLVFIPVNNENTVAQRGGSHWSLLIYRRSLGFEHYDSAGHDNLSMAYHIARQFSHTLDLSGIDMHSHVTSFPTPQQTNSYDCGMYLLAITKYIATAAVTSNNAETLHSVLSEVSPKVIRDMRGELFSIISSHSKK